MRNEELANGYNNVENLFVKFTINAILGNIYDTNLYSLPITVEVVTIYRRTSMHLIFYLQNFEQITYTK